MFKSAIEKWIRGTQHLVALNDAIVAFGKTKPCTFVANVEPDSGDKVWRVVGKPATPPIQLSIILGDAIYNFRSSLDHLVYEMVIRTGGQPTTSTGFPIYDSKHSWKSSNIAKLTDLPTEIRTAVRAYQPCYGLKPHRVATFAGFEALYTNDKHRYLNLVTAATDGGFWSHGLPVNAQASIHDGPLYEDTELARVSHQHVDVDFYPVFGVAFAEGGPVSRKSVILYLYSFRIITQEIIETFPVKFFGVCRFSLEDRAYKL